ncbi:hypothetical protein EON79_00990 [bacterium]|nr:MAG: hypothetical protein EON79_00990 [bacterium]
MSKSQPKILQKMLFRTLGLVIVMGGLLFAYQWMRQNKGGISELKKASTKGWILAIKYQPEGQQAVAIKPDGTIVENPSWKPGVTDRDLVWQPDGNRAFFVSDRDARDAKPGVKVFNIYRWNPDANEEPDQRTLGTRGRSDIAFPVAPVEGSGPQTALITSGGFVLEFDSEANSTRQVLPPLGNEVATSSEEGTSTSTSQFSAFYSEIGTSFRTARWLRNKDFVAGPVAGERIDIAVDPKSGDLVASVMGFRFPPGQPIDPRFKQGNKIVVPFKNALFRLDPEAGMQPPIVANNDVAFGSPVVSPDGNQIAMVVGPFQDGAIRPELLAWMKSVPSPDNKPTVVTQGEVFEPTWSKDGSKIIYVKRVNGARSIFQVSWDGLGDTNLTAGKGDFALPRQSPQ